MKIWHTVRLGHLLMPSGENSFFILSQRIQRGDDDRGVSRENDSFFLIFATWAILPGLRLIHKWRTYSERPLEALKQVEAKNLSSSSASLKKLRPGAVLTSTQFCALEKIETNMSACGHVCFYLFLTRTELSRS